MFGRHHFEPLSLSNESKGYACYLPSVRVLRDFYLRFIGPFQDHTAILSARVVQVDHSLKVSKHLGKLNSVPNLAAFHASVKEHCESQFLVMIMRKFQRKIIAMLGAFLNFLETYRQRLVKASNDNRNDIDPEPDPTLVLPSDSAIHVLSSVQQVNARLKYIMNKIPGDKEFYVAIDTEWAVDPHTRIAGPTALLSMTFGREIILIPLVKYYRGGKLHLPRMLLAFLRAPNIRKVGVRVSADILRLFRDCGFTLENDAPFSGALNLGIIAKEAGISTSAGIGLFELCIRVLGRFLPKDPGITISTEWELDPLPDEHIRYAALDAYATWAVFKAISTLTIGKRVEKNKTPPGTRISLLSTDYSDIIAFGQISLDQPSEHGGINISKSRILVNISEVVQPEHRVSVNPPSAVQPEILSSFGPAPFTLVCQVRHLRVRAHISDLPLMPQSASPPTKIKKLNQASEKQ
ncbi:ribonuclease H-like protein [Pholiota conissans]|uniref:Ribonuclease H-like protein n=1 Tax=Pholiota conissans TaxID=109636 RepID=A0A9P5ZDZ1_9AGAR|nr:ribonuclease H-like protein [Pholiota conissans]